MAFLFFWSKEIHWKGKAQMAIHPNPTSTMGRAKLIAMSLNINKTLQRHAPDSSTLKHLKQQWELKETKQNQTSNTPTKHRDLFLKPIMPLCNSKKLNFKTLAQKGFPGTEIRKSKMSFSSPIGLVHGFFETQTMPNKQPQKLGHNYWQRKEKQ